MNPQKAEFIELARRSGWSQAEIARKLEMTRGGVNGIITGPTIPSLVALKLFRMTLAQEKPEALVGTGPPDLTLEPWEKKLVSGLRQLSDTSRRHAMEVINAVMTTYPGSPDPVAILSDKEQSEVDVAASNLAQKAVEQIRGTDKYPRSRKAVSPTGKASGPRPASALHSISPQTPPTPVPK